jgi:hypothetical protein
MLGLGETNRCLKTDVDGGSWFLAQGRLRQGYPYVTTSYPQNPSRTAHVCPRDTFAGTNRFMHEIRENKFKESSHVLVRLKNKR